MSPYFIHQQKLPLPERGRCMVPKNRNHQFLPIEFYWPGRLMQNNNQDDKVYRGAGINNRLGVLRCPVFVYDEDDSNW